MSFHFQDRVEAGWSLADRLEGYSGRDDVVILGLPRGGVPVAYEVATKLRAPLHAFIVRKLGVPGHEELAMGAIASGGAITWNDKVLDMVNLPCEVLKKVIAREQQEMARREDLFRTGPLPELRNKTVLIVDDGLATGASMRAAVLAARQFYPARIVVGVPVASPDAMQELQKMVDEVVCVWAPPDFCGVGEWYQNFPQTTDEEVRELLATHGEHNPPQSARH